MTKNERDQLFKQIRELIVSSRRIAVRTVDTVHVMTNFMVGRMIVEHQQGGEGRAEYGKQTLEQLSSQLTAEFRRGYSVRNLREMRRFYLAYLDRLPQIRQNISAELPDPKNLSPEGVTEVRDTAGQIAAIPPGGPSPFTLRWSMYVNYFDREVKQDEEHPTIGILLCKMKDDAMVELTLSEDANIYASQYQLYLPSKEQLRERLLQWYEQSSEDLLPPDDTEEP